MRGIISSIPFIQITSFYVQFKKKYFGIGKSLLSILVYKSFFIDIFMKVCFSGQLDQKPLLDFYLCARVKNIVYQTLPTTLENLIQRI